MDKWQDINNKILEIMRNVLEHNRVNENKVWIQLAPHVSMVSIHNENCSPIFSYWFSDSENMPDADDLCFGTGGVNKLLEISKDFNSFFGWRND